MKSRCRKSTFFFLSIHLLTYVYIWVLCPLNFTYSKYLCRVYHLNEPLGYWREEKTSDSKFIFSLTDASLTSDSGGWAWNYPVTLAGWSSSCSWLSFSLSPGLGVSSAYPEYMGYVGICSFPAPLWHHCLLLFFFFCFVFNGSEKCLCMILFSLQSSFCKSLLAKELWAWVAWVRGVRWCNQLPSGSSPTANYPLCVCHLRPDSPSPRLCSNMFLPLSLFHCNVLNTSFFPSDR